MKNFFITPLNLKLLKRDQIIFYNKKIKLSLFFKKNYYIFHGGDRFIMVHIPILFPRTNLTQYIFSKKPFSGPIKKGRM